MKKIFAAFLAVLFLSACAPGEDFQAAQTAKGLTAAAALWTETPALTATANRAPTKAATVTPTIEPTLTDTPGPTLTPTFSFPTVIVNKQAHCRYGPSSAYLHAADLYAGDKGQVRGRFEFSSWLFVKFDKLAYWCWVAPSVIDISGDISTVEYTTPNLQAIGFNLYGPPQNVSAVRKGNKVTITWDKVAMTQDDDRGYLIEAWVCQNGSYLWWTDSLPDQYATKYTVVDEPGCSAPSSGQITTVEKHGFSEPAMIPWP